MQRSFRDPGGRLSVSNKRVIRYVHEPSEGDLRSFLGSATSQKFVASGHLVRTKFLGDDEIADVLEESAAEDILEGEGPSVVEHERIPFQSFPYEWPPEMLYSAGRLTLDLAGSSLAEGYGLKDATPYNVLFRGPRPVFVDLLSFERRDPFDAVWLPYAQFVRTFLLPLLVNKNFGIPLDQILMTRRDGLEPQEVYRLSGFAKRFSPSFLTAVSLPTWLSSKTPVTRPSGPNQKEIGDAEKARFVLGRQFKLLRRALERSAPQVSQRSAWSDYMGPDRHFSEEYLQQKQGFVEAALAECKPKGLLDVGCNTGHFSRLAAQAGASVVAIDQDPVVIGQVWRWAYADGLDILPLVVNLARPSPPTGWRNLECPGFLQRAREAFDFVLMLAVIHHMLVSERIPLREIIDLAAELTSDRLVIEFVAPEDPMFRHLARGREHLHKGLSNESFEAACRRRFDLIRAQRLHLTSRWIYLLRKKRRHA